VNLDERENKREGEGGGGSGTRSTVHILAKKLGGFERQGEEARLKGREWKEKKGK